VIGASLVDAINPCAFAVLIVLLTTVLAQKGQTRRVLASGLAFSAAIFVSYLLMGLGVYQALASAHSTGLFTAVVGVLAILLGLFNLKDWLWYGRTPPMEVPMSWRPKMASFIERVTSPVGALAAGLVVSLFLLPCTSGPYIVVLGLLADNPLDVGAVFYLVLYNLIFILPMLLITVLVARGLDVDRLSYLREKHIQKLHLVAGLILIGLGTYVLLT
jgi:cytochrome c biogenesis protein CcdA